MQKSISFVAVELFTYWSRLVLLKGLCHLCPDVVLPKDLVHWQLVPGKCFHFVLRFWGF